MGKMIFMLPMIVAVAINQRKDAQLLLINLVLMQPIRVVVLNSH